MQNYLIRLLGLLLTTTLPANAEILRFKQVDQGVYRGSQPQNSRDYDTLQSLGIKTILNLRTSGAVDKERAIAEKRGMNFVHAPISNISTILLPPRVSSVERALDALSNPNLSPIFVHCKVGKDRTGYIVALHQILHRNVSPRVAFKEMYAMGFSRYFVGLEKDLWARTLTHLLDPSSLFATEHAFE